MACVLYETACRDYITRRDSVIMIITKITTAMKSRSRKTKVVVATIDQKIEDIFSKEFGENRIDIKFLRKASDVLLLILEEDIDLLIVDLELSGISGIDLIPIIRKSRPRLPLIVISNDFTYQVRKMVAQEGVTYQIFKPVNTRELTEVIETTQNILEGQVKAGLC